MQKQYNTYLGQKGYTISKTELTIEDQKQIRNDLTIKPFVMGSPLNNNQQTFPAYRESTNKMYVPHHYGVDHFGLPKEYKISEGDNIDLTFNGALRPNQVPVVEIFTKHCLTQKYGGGLLELECAAGKCLGKGTKILMYDGTIKNVEDVLIGDKLMGDDSTLRNVLSLARGKEQMYKINNETTGENYICNESHILSLKCVTSTGYAATIDISVKNYLNMQQNNKNNKNNTFYGYKVPIEFSGRFTKPLEMDPYAFGLWLGSTVDLQEPGFPKNKCISPNYLCNTRINRLALLAGIIDSFGTVYDNYIQIIHCENNTNLVNDIVFLARSLGFACFKKSTIDASYLITIYGSGIEEIPTFILTEKGYDETLNKTNALYYQIHIEKLQVDDYYGFEIDGNRRFVLGDFTVTHNTVLSLNIISQLKKKTLVIVHKEFLMNQWIERIEQFLPKARVGKIQGQIIDIDNKDIVIGMLQSLSMKEYPASVFESFGLTIIDEVHHISSEVFSNSLFKIITKYMLGLSATMNRKDGTTFVFKMFLGEIIFKSKREEQHNVTVRAIEYIVNDDEFNETKLDYRGKPAYSSMISKLCEYNRRSEFILKVLADMFQENPKQQIMVLAHNRNLLTYLHDAIKHRNIATVGYYVGGMKEKALKETESKSVVIATFNMAAEALDIRTLTTLIMATPKTDIEQSVGRILREKHSNPIVVDIIDSHDVFKNQWRKRKTFYKKQNYKIIYTTSLLYTPDTSNWDTVFLPNKSMNLCNKEKNKEPHNNSGSTKKNKTASSDKSITTESDSESDDEEPKDKLLCGKCLLKFKK